MTERTASRTVVIRNPKGMHMRPADLLVREAMKFQAQIHLVREGDLYDAKSMLSVMTLAAEQGQELLLRAQGPDAERAVEALAELFERGFDEMPITTKPSRDQATDT